MNVCSKKDRFIKLVPNEYINLFYLIPYNSFNSSTEILNTIDLCLGNIFLQTHYLIQNMQLILL